MNRVSVHVTNTGTRHGTTVPQLYLGFPASAGEPPKQLKGFTQVSLEAGASTTVTFPLDNRSLSIWDVAKAGWAVQEGAFTAMVGTSSRDIRANATFVVRP